MLNIYISFQEGDSVYLSLGSGTYAEYALADEHHTHKLQSTLSFSVTNIQYTKDFMCMSVLSLPHDVQFV